MVYNINREIKYKEGGAMRFKVGDKVRICSNPHSLLKSHADKEAEIIKAGTCNFHEWLLRIDGNNWWAKSYDFEKIESEDPLPCYLVERIKRDKKIRQ